MNGDNHILLFDGVCNLCNGLIRFIIRHDKKKKFKFATLQSSAGKNLMISAPEKIRNADSIVYTDGRIFLYKSKAVFKVFEAIGGTWKLLLIFKIIPGGLCDIVYNFIARTRYRIFGKRSVCMVPTIEILDRFLT